MLPVFKFQIFNFISNTDHAHTHLRIISLVLVQPQACKVPSIQTSVSQHSLNCIYIISCLQHMTTWHAQHWAVCHREQHCLSLWCHQSPQCRSMVLLCAYRSKTQHNSSSVKMMAVFVVFTLCFRRTYGLHLKGEWLGEGWMWSDAVKGNMSVWGNLSNHSHWRGAEEHTASVFWVTELVLVNVQWWGGRNVSIISEDWGNLAVHSCHSITSGPAWQNSVNLQTMYYSEMLEKTQHTTWY